ncbi:MAG: hypothetical protein OXE40_19310, partial [Gammaproteobacteria bacterium]|nr:hypothetical protein [Gammaproteobacteria bacterium]
MQDAHRRLVRAIACGVSEQRSESGGSELPVGFNWKNAYGAIVDRYSMDKMGSDYYALTASMTALQDIGRAVMGAYCENRVKWTLSAGDDPADTMDKIRTMERTAKRTSNRPRLAAIHRSLHDINRLTYARHTELERRRVEFLSVSLPGACPVPDREALGRWLRSQAESAPGTGKVHAYFTHLEQ